MQHKLWCLTAPDGAVKAEDQARGDELQTCQNCQDYANRALKRARTNVAYNCGGGGPRYSLDFGAHVRFCQSVQPFERQREDDARTQFLGQCLQDYGKAHAPPDTSAASPTPQRQCSGGMIVTAWGGCDCPAHTYFDGRQCVSDGTAGARKCQRYPPRPCRS
jgi:hypothetical protein